jgi:hypothetical protein
MLKLMKCLREETRGKRMRMEKCVYLKIGFVTFIYKNVVVKASRFV